MPRCKLCGGFTHHVITDLSGRRIYRCSTRLTSMNQNLDQSEWTKPCQGLWDDLGQAVSGFIAFVTDGKVETVKAESLTSR